MSELASESGVEPTRSAGRAERGRALRQLLDVRELAVTLPGPRGAVRVLDGVSFTVEAGRTTGLIGESGSGKTMTAMAVIGLLPAGATAEGELWWSPGPTPGPAPPLPPRGLSPAPEPADIAAAPDQAPTTPAGEGEDLLRAGPRRRRQLRGREIAMIFQDPLAALNPSQTIGRQVAEIPRRDGASRAEQTRIAVELLEHAGIPDARGRIDDYPHQFSGGLRQRAMTALALAGRPKLILADEPTTALDVTVQARILAMLRRLREQEDLAMLLVSHDLRVMAHVADELVVMYAGRVCERGPARATLRSPRHPYTRALVDSVPAVRTRTVIAAPLPGAPADPGSRPTGCAFHPRCPIARERCVVERPVVRQVAPDRWSACHFAEELAS